MDGSPVEVTPEVRSRPIRDLGLAIAGSLLEPIVAEFLRELDAVGLVRTRPVLYLSTEWGVPDGTVAIAIPFYLARSDFARYHAERTGHLEGRSPSDILRYLRHEMGHVVNYAHRLYDREDWSRLFGPISHPYREDYRPEPFSRDYVRHLPGWYAQKHPDEDWSETFAVWMTPGLDWEVEYEDWPVALAKLSYCDLVMNEVARSAPPFVASDLDEDVSQIAYSLDEFYETLEDLGEPLPSGLDAALRSLFEDLGEPEAGAPIEAPRKLASALITTASAEIATEVYRWTGHFPERTKVLLRHLADRADTLNQVYPEALATSALIGLTALVTALASNFIRRGRYLL